MLFPPIRGFNKPLAIKALSRIISADKVVLAESIAYRQKGNRYYRRYYPQGALAAQVVGYATPQQGSTGLEQQYNRYLAGSYGTGAILDRLRQETKDGADIRLTLDTRVQKTAEALLSGRRGAVVAIEPKTKDDQDKLGKALKSLSDEDPTFRVSTHPETGQTIISGMGELHLEIIVDRLKREFKVDANVGKPQVAYRETITKPVDVEGKFIRQTGGRGQYGHVKIKVEPLPRGSGFEFVNAIVGGVIPKEYIPAVQKGIEEAMQSGPLIGFPVVDIKVTLYDGSYHEVDSSEMAFKIAGSMAIKEAVQKGDPVILEPIMRVEVTTPEEYMGDVIGDLNARRGQILGMEPRGNAQVIRAFVPLAEMFGYATDLRSKTQGRGSFVMFFDHYQEVPKQVQEKLIKGQ